MMRSRWRNGRTAAADRAGRESRLRYCARPPFTMDRRPELDPERLIYDPPKPGPGGSGPPCLTPLELLDRLAAQVLHPRLHRHRYFGAPVRTTAYWKFSRRPRTAAVGGAAGVSRFPNGGTSPPGCQQGRNHERATTVLRTHLTAANSN